MDQQKGDALNTVRRQIVLCELPFSGKFYDHFEKHCFTLEIDFLGVLFAVQISFRMRSTTKQTMFKNVETYGIIRNGKKVFYSWQFTMMSLPLFHFHLLKKHRSFVTDKLTYNNQASRRLADLRDEHFMNIKINGQLSKMNKIN